MQKEEIKKNIKSGSMWLRVFFIILFAIFYGVAMSVFWFLVVFQIIHGLITGSPNERVLSFSSGLTAYLYQVLNYLSVQAEQKPFPFDEWPSGKDRGAVVKAGTAESDSTSG